MSASIPLLLWKKPKHKVFCILGQSNYNTNVGSGSNIDNLAAGDFTIDGYFRVFNTGAYQYLCAKTSGADGWYFRVNDTGTLLFTVKLATTQMSAASTATVNDGRWHYLIATWTLSTRIGVLYSDGALIKTSTAGTGAYVDDLAVNGYLSYTSLYLTGKHGWIRWSNAIRPATYLSRFSPPAIDANTMAQWNVKEGSGLTLADASNNGNNGTISGGKWLME